MLCPISSRDDSYPSPARKNKGTKGENCADKWEKATRSSSVCGSVHKSKQKQAGRLLSTLGPWVSSLELTQLGEDLNLPQGLWASNTTCRAIRSQSKVQKGKHIQTKTHSYKHKRIQGHLRNTNTIIILTSKNMFKSKSTGVTSAREWYLQQRHNVKYTAGWGGHNRYLTSRNSWKWIETEWLREKKKIQAERKQELSCPQTPAQAIRKYCRVIKILLYSNYICLLF